MPAIAYSQFAPSTFDTAGLGLSDRQTWLVGPCFRNRDSGPAAESNFAAMVSMLGGESDACEVHRFGHWANGWFELAIVPESRRAELDAIESALSDYPILDDSDLSERESNGASDAWTFWGRKEFADICARTFGLAYEARELLAQSDDLTFAFQLDHAPTPYEWGDSEVSFPMGYLASDRGTTRAEMAALLWACRAAAREQRAARAR
jgi:hypothetical protein